MPGIRLQNLQFAYPGSTFALHVPDLSIDPSRPFALLGPSGAGKTTLLRLMTGLLLPSFGEVHLGETNLSSLGSEAQRRFRLQEMGLIFQDFALLDYLTVAENILLPQRFTGTTPSASFMEQARALTSSLHIAQHWQRPVSLLSQGERQRVAIARALVHRPKYVFADEPTASLDAARRGSVMELLLRHVQETQASLVMVTHDPELLPLFPHHARIGDFSVASPSPVTQEGRP